jgi:hypothetical protein
MDNPDRKTPPEQGPESANVAGRPAVERPRTAFHVATETPEEERAPLSEADALEEGGSFDGVAPPQELDLPPS